MTCPEGPTILLASRLKQPMFAPMSMTDRKGVCSSDLRDVPEQLGIGFRLGLNRNDLSRRSNHFAGKQAETADVRSNVDDRSERRVLFRSTRCSGAAGHRFSARAQSQ